MNYINNNNYNEIIIHKILEKALTLPDWLVTKNSINNISYNIFIVQKKTKKNSTNVY